jgi:hypothetical protein
MNVEDIDEQWEFIEQQLFDQNQRLIRFNDMLQMELALMSNYLLRKEGPNGPTLQ